MKKQQPLKIFILCALAVCINVVLGSFITFTGIPLLFLDAMGTIFIAANFKMQYGVLTGLCTNLLLAVIHGPLALPFGLVSITIAIVVNLCAKNGFGYKKAILTGILVTLIGSLVSAPIRLILYGGFAGLNRTVSDIVVFSLKASGREMLIAAYWGAVTDGIVDKIASCVLVSWLGQLPVIKGFLAPYHSGIKKRFGI